MWEAFDKTVFEHNYLVLGVIYSFPSARVQCILFDVVHTAHTRLLVHKPATDCKEMGFDISHPLISLGRGYLTDGMRITYPVYN